MENRNVSQITCLLIYMNFRKQGIPLHSFPAIKPLKCFLTLSQTTNYRLVQTERVCRKQFQI